MCETENTLRSGKSGRGLPQSKTRGVYRRLTNRAKRPGVRQPSGVFIYVTGVYNANLRTKLKRFKVFEMKHERKVL
jgi:hypothetical protein